MVVMDSGRAASRRTGMTALIFEVVSTLTRNTGIEIDLLRIFFFDQPNFQSRRGASRAGQRPRRGTHENFITRQQKTPSWPALCRASTSLMSCEEGRRCIMAQTPQDK
jgi:hypothetical protein